MTTMITLPTAAAAAAADSSQFSILGSESRRGDFETDPATRYLHRNQYIILRSAHNILSRQPHNECHFFLLDEKIQ